MPDAFDPYRKWLGIPPAEQPPHHYRLLAIGLFEDDPDVIENAADQRMAHLRTFQAGSHSALSQKLLNEVAAAKLCLLAADRKAEYDARLRRQLAAVAPANADSRDEEAMPIILAPTTRPTQRSPRPPAATKKQASAAMWMAGVAGLCICLVAAYAMLGAGQARQAATGKTAAEKASRLSASPEASGSMAAEPKASFPTDNAAPSVSSSNRTSEERVVAPPVAQRESAVGAHASETAMPQPSDDGPATSPGAAVAENDDREGKPALAAGPLLAIAPFDAKSARDHQEAWAKYLNVPVEQENSLGMRLVLIPPGEFAMGSTPEQIEHAKTYDGDLLDQRGRQWMFDRLQAEAFWRNDCFLQS